VSAIAAGALPVLAAAVVGLALGSWASLLIHRLPAGAATVLARSRCPRCGTALGPRDLVPLVSRFAARGRCRHCGGRIPWRYPATEGAGAGLTAAAWLAAPGPLPAALLALLGIVLLTAAVIDLEHYRLPDALTAAAAGLAVAWHATAGAAAWPALATGALGAALAGGLALLVRAAFARLTGADALGLGDVKLMAAAGLWLGPAGVPALLVLGGGLGLVTGALWRRAGRGPAFPFGPALAAAFFALACAGAG